MHQTGSNAARRLTPKCGLRWLILAAIATSLLMGTLGFAANPDSKGTDFWLAFPGNLGTPTLSLFITGDANTSGTVSIPGLAFSAPFTVTAGTVTTVAIPA